MKNVRCLALASVAIPALWSGAVHAQDNGETDTPSSAASPVEQNEGNELAYDASNVITVTARRQDETLIETPASVSVLTAENLANSGIVTTEQAIALTPGVTIVSNAAQVGDAQINIRGINGARDAENNVALVVDGILKTNTAAVNQYQGDLTQFEVLKGPQGAYYGRGAIAGAIVLTTREPGDELLVTGRARSATQNTQLLEGSISGPLTETIGAVVYGRYSHTDGFYENTGPDGRTRGDTIDNAEDWSVGGRVVFKPTSNLTLDAKGRYGEIEAGALKFQAVFALPGFANAFGDPNFYEDVNDHVDRITFLRNVPSVNNLRTIEGSLKADYEFDSSTLTTWVSYSDIDETFVADATGAALGRFNGTQSCIDSTARLFAAGYQLPSPLILAPTPADSIYGAFGPTTCDGYQVTVRNQKDISAEVRLASNTNDPLQWSIGAYYLNIDRRYANSINADSGGNYDDTLYNPPGSPNPTSQLFDDRYRTDVYAGFGSLEYSFDKLTLSGALRFDREERSVEPLVEDVIDPITGGSINPGYDVGTLSREERVYQQLQPKLTVSYEITPDLNVYADYGVGFKAGGFNSQGSEALINIFFNNLLGSNIGIRDDFKKEVSNAIEVGVKASLLQGDLNIAAAVYRNMVEDSQFFEYYTGTFGLLRVVSNIDKVRLQGVELGIDYRLSDAISLNVGGNLLDSKILDNSVRPDTEGNKAPYAADYTLNAGVLVEYPLDTDLDILMKADYRLTGPTWFHTVQDQTRRTIFDAFFPGLGTGDYSKTQRDAYSIVNVRLGLKTDSWRLTGFVDNLFKTDYLEEVIPAPEFGGSFVSPGARRKFGLEFGFEF